MEIHLTRAAAQSDLFSYETRLNSAVRDNSIAWQPLIASLRHAAVCVGQFNRESMGGY